jgi:hypothetical protein
LAGLVNANTTVYVLKRLPKGEPAAPPAAKTEPAAAPAAAKEQKI